MSTQSRFYSVNIDTPLSLAHNTSQWDRSTIGKLNSLTEGSIFIREIPRASRNAEYGWRVVDAYFSQEDSVITHFHAYDLDGAFIAGASYGVHYDDQSYRISGGFKYAPEFGNQYYVPVESNFTTPNTGGYTVQVLDLEYPSEGLGFGMYKQGEKHSALIVKFRLFKLEAKYPNDLDLPIR